MSKTLLELLNEQGDYATEVAGEYFIRYSGGLENDPMSNEEIMQLADNDIALELRHEELDELSQHRSFIEDIAGVVAEHCGGEIHHNDGPDRWILVSANEALPSLSQNVWVQHPHKGCFSPQKE